MKRFLFETWNWEFDYGIRQIKPSDNFPLRYCEAFIDGRDRLCRVILHESHVGDGPSIVAIYDYFCSDNGDVVQKRSYSADGSPDLVIDYAISDGWVTETAHSFADDTLRSIRRRVQAHPHFGVNDDSLSG